MAALSNPRHERFAQGLAQGLTAEAAYEAAGYKANRGNAATLKAKQSISARVAELQERAGEKVALSKAWVLDRLRQIAERCLQAEPVMRGGAPAQTETADGEMARAYVFNSAGANRALELIGKELGMFIDRKDIRVRRLEDLTEEELHGLLAELDGGRENPAAARRSR